MREVLFKAKRKDNGEWVEGGYCCYNNKSYIITVTKYIPDTRDWDMANYYEESPVYKPIFIEVYSETVGQFTGLTDKNGKKIFERDIVQATVTYNDYPRDMVNHQTSIFEIKYHEKHCYFYLARKNNNLLFDGNWTYFLREIEVIGNIHDNPELLGDK
jgi:uncharacterized phage protein (TIGR01671 family)